MCWTKYAIYRQTEQEEREKRGDMPLEMAQAMHETVEEKELKQKKKKKKKDPSHSYASKSCLLVGFKTYKLLHSHSSS